MGNKNMKNKCSFIRIYMYSVITEEISIHGSRLYAFFLQCLLQLYPNVQHQRKINH